MVKEVIQNISIQEFRTAWARHISNRAADPKSMPPQDYLRTAYIIWAKEFFSFTHLKIIYKKGNEKMGHVVIPMPLDKINFRKDFKEIQAKKILDKSLG
jgi:hypothetical protein